MFEAIEDSKPAARIVYDSSAYGNEIKEIIGLRTIASASGSYQAAEPSDRLAGVEREFRQKLAAIEPGSVERIARFVDDGLSPAAVAIGAVTGGVGGTFFSRATGVAGAALGVVENVAIDAATGTVLVTAGVKPEEHPALAMATGVGIGLGTGVLRLITGLAGRQALSALSADDVARGVARAAGLPEGEARHAIALLQPSELVDPAAVARAARGAGLSIDDDAVRTGIDRAMFAAHRGKLSDADFHAALSQSTGLPAAEVQKTLAGIDAGDSVRVAAALRGKLDVTKGYRITDPNYVDEQFVQQVAEEAAFTKTIATLPQNDLDAVGLQSFSSGGALVVRHGPIIKTPKELADYLDRLPGGGADQILAKAREVMGGDHVQTIKNNQLGVLTQRPAQVEVTLPSGAQIVIEPASAGQNLRLLAMARRLETEFPAPVAFLAERNRLSIKGYDVPELKEIIVFKWDNQGYHTPGEARVSNLISFAQDIENRLSGKVPSHVAPSPDYLRRAREDLQSAKDEIKDSLPLMDLEKMGIKGKPSEMSDDELSQIVNGLVRDARFTTTPKSVFSIWSAPESKLGAHVHPASPGVGGASFAHRIDDLDQRLVLLMEKSPFHTRYWTPEEAARLKASAREQLPTEIEASELLLTKLQLRSTALPKSKADISNYRAAVEGALREGSEERIQALGGDIFVDKVTPRFGPNQDPLAPRERLEEFLRRVTPDSDYLAESARKAVARDIAALEQKARRARDLLGLVQSGASDRELFFKAVPRTLTPSPKDVGHLLGKNPITLTVGGKPVQIRAGVIVFPHGTTTTIIEDGSDTVQLVRVFEDQPRTFSSLAGAQPFRAEVESVPLSALGIRGGAGRVAAVGQLRLPEEALAPTPRPLVAPPPKPLHEIREDTRRALEDTAQRLKDVEARAKAPLGDAERIAAQEDVSRLRAQERLMREVQVAVDQGTLADEIQRGARDGGHFRVKAVMAGHPEGVVPDSGVTLSSDVVHVESGFFAVADISGHGNARPTRGATTEIKELLSGVALPARDELFNPPSARIISSWVGEIAEKNREPGAFATLNAARLSPDGGLTLMHVDDVFVISTGGGVKKLESTGGLLGIPGISFGAPRQLRLQPGDKVVLASDGLKDSLRVSEPGVVRDIPKEEYEALIRGLAAADNPTAFVSERIASHFDDISVLIIEYTGR